MDNPLFEGSYSDALKLAGNTAGKTAGKFGLKEALLIGLPSIADDKAIPSLPNGSTIFIKINSLDKSTNFNKRS